MGRRKITIAKNIQKESVRSQRVALEIIESKQQTTDWSTKRCISIAIVSLLLGSAIFLIAYIGIHQNSGIASLNQPILTYIIDHRMVKITDIMKIIAVITNPLFFALTIFAIAFFWAVLKREIWRPILLASAMGIATVASTFLKAYTMVARPAQINMIQPFEIDYSFPSGHTIVIAVFMLVIGYLICSRRSSFGQIFSWIFFTIIAVGIVASSRLYLGYHWLTDIVASLGLGLIILAIIIFIDRIAVGRSEN